MSKQAIVVVLALLIVGFGIAVVWGISSDNESHSKTNDRMREICQQYGYESAGCKSS